MNGRVTRAISTTILFGAAVAAGGFASATEWTGLAIYPPEISLSTSTDYQRIVVVATRADGVTLDATGESEITVAPGGTPDEAVAVLHSDGALYPLRDGETQLVARFAGLEAKANVKVTDGAQPRPVSYSNDIMPVFMRTGCNSGSCHGSSRGKDGFRLSLFGFDPAGDHYRLTHELPARRLNLALPDESLLLEKAVGAVPHTGGKRFEPDSWYYETIREWLAIGAPSDLGQVPDVAELSIYPPRAVLEGQDARQQFVAVATYGDGTTRDVSNLAVFMSNNESSASIDPDGLVTSGQRGEAFVMARFDTHTVGSQVLALPAGEPFKPSEEAPANYVDELVTKKLDTLRIHASPVATDEEFLRRVHVDIVGTLPTREEYDTFVADTSPDKRSAKIDQLLERKEFSEIWAMKWAELLMVKTLANRVEYKPMFLYSQWLTKQIADEVPLDEMVRKLLGASGGSFSSPAVNFYQIEPTTQKTAENVAQVFLGIRVQCAQCHNHPFDRWTMDDYFAFTAFFSQIGRKQAEDYRETIVFDRRGGEVKHPVGGRVMKPKFLGGEEPDTQGRDRRAVVAEWITAPDNPWFATSVANRVWAHFLGVGIVEPVDDFRVSNPPSNPELLETLGARLVEYGYDFKQLVRDICNSHTYQRSSLTNESNQTDNSNFSHAKIRRIPAETLLDCICQVTEAAEKFRGLPLGAKAVQIADGKTSTYFLTTFGRSKRDTVCACEAKTEPTLSQALHLLNGSAAHQKIRQGKVVERLLDEGRTPQEVIDDIYLRCLSRKPLPAENEQLAALVGTEARPVGELHDVFWAVLNSREFLFNH